MVERLSNQSASGNANKLLEKFNQLSDYMNALLGKTAARQVSSPSFFIYTISARVFVVPCGHKTAITEARTVRDGNQCCIDT